MKRNIKKPALVTVSLLTLALVACSNTPKSGAGETLTVLDYYNNDPEKAMIQGVLDACAKDLNVKVQREAVPGASLIQKVLQKASAKTLPDVLMLDNPDLQQFAETGALAPFDTFKISTDGYAAGILDAATYKGKVYGLGPTVNTLALFYNKKLLAESGVTSPTNWNELKAAAKALTKGDTYGVAFSGVATYEGSWQFLPFMWTNGGDETNLLSPDVAAALQLWVDLVNSGSASKGVINWSQGDVNDQFIAGKTAMMVNGPWQIPALSKASGLDYGVVQIPVNTVGQKPVAPLGGELWTVPQTGNKDKQALAAKLVECINSDKNQLMLAQQRFTVPTKTALVGEFTSKVPSMKAFAEQVSTARSRTGKLGTKWPDTAKQIYTAIQLALAGKASPADAFKEAVK